MSSPTQLKKKHKEDAALLAETRKSFSVLHVGNPSIHPSPVPGPGWYHIPRGMKNPVQALPWVGRSSSYTTDVTDNGTIGHTDYGCTSAHYNFADDLPEDAHRNPEDLIEYLDPKEYPEYYI